MNYSQQRKHPRVPVRLPIQVYVQGQKYRAEITDISEGGAFVHGTIPVQIGAEVVIKVSVIPPLEIQEKYRNGVPSVVRWVRGSSHAGFGVEFR